MLTERRRRRRKRCGEGANVLKVNGRDTGVVECVSRRRTLLLTARHLFERRQPWRRWNASDALGAVQRLARIRAALQDMTSGTKALDRDVVAPAVRDRAWGSKDVIAVVVCVLGRRGGTPARDVMWCVRLTRSGGDGDPGSKARRCVHSVCRQCAEA